MFQPLKKLSMQRWPWLLLAGSAFLLELTGLYFQYVLNYQPCIKCVYVRVAFAGILLTALLVSIAPKNVMLRLFGLLGWLLAAGFGFSEAQQLVNIEHILAEGGFTTCALFANFPTWLALDQWLPSVFAVTGTCGGVDWQFAGWSMAEWSRFIMACYFVAGLVIALSQVARISTNPYRS